MLEHEPQQESTVPASQVRVSPEELAQALTRWQARREGTLTLGDAVRELDLDATPEELLREIIASRAATTAQASSSAGGRRHAVAWFSAALLAFLIGLVGLASLRSPSVVPPPVAPAAVSAPATGRVSWSDATLVEDTAGPHPILRTLGEVHPGVPVRVSITATGQSVGLSDLSNPADAWTVIKFGGRLYLRGWIVPMSVAAMQSSPVTLYSDKPGGTGALTPEQVTVRLDTLTVTPGLSSDDQLSATHLSPDSHFHDTW